MQTQGNNMEEVNYVEGVSVVHFNELEDCYKDKEKECLWSSKNIEICNIAETGETSACQEDRRTADLLPLLTNEPIAGMKITEPLVGNFKEEGMADCGEKTEDGSGSKRLGFDIGLASKIHTVKQFDFTSVIKERKDKMKMNGPSGAPFLEKLESTAENDVHYKDVCRQNEERAQRGEPVPVVASSRDSRILLYQMKGKGKEKSSSTREVNDRSKDEDDSQGSMESCNSANLFSKGKRQLSFDQQLINGSKRIKKQIQESPSNSLVKRESSFMNWISNMVKGLDKSNQEEGHSIALSIGRPNHEHESYDQKIASCNKTHNFEGRKMGFQTIFQSLYCPDTKVHESRIHIDDFSVGGSKELVLAEKCEDDKSFNQLLISSDNFKRTTSGYGEGPSIHACKIKTLTNVVGTEAKDILSSLDSFRGEKKSRSAEGNSSDPMSEGKTVNIMGNASDPLGSLWITRFSPKTPCRVLNLDHCNQKSLEAREGSTDDAVNVLGKELQNYSPTNAEASIGLKKIGGHNYQKPFRLNSSESLKIPEEMTSVFASRLDAFKVAGICNLRKGRTDIDITSTSKGNGKIFSKKRILNSDEVQKHFALGSGEDKLFEERLTPLCNFASKQISDSQKGMFDAIRRLRLSRTDILKSMKSHISVSQLDGFFLRLRLAKWEERLGGAGYYVACITGTQREKKSKSSKNPIRVSVGGIECMVESQYVSNYEFLEDELMAWWHKASRSGQIPTDDDLKSKLEDRKKLGL